MTEQKPSYAALIRRTIYIPGDERSRTHPGHGYPASSEEVTDMKKFDSREAMEAWVQEQEHRNRYATRVDYTLIEYRELRVTSRVEVAVE